MDINLFKQDDVEKRVLVEFPGLTLTNENIKEDAALIEQVNSGEDFTIGSTCCAQLKFNIMNLNQLVRDSDISGREFTYKLGARTGQVSMIDVRRKLGNRTFILHGAHAFAIAPAAPYLTMWSVGKTITRVFPDWNASDAIDAMWDSIESSDITWEDFDSGAYSYSVPPTGGDLDVLRLPDPEQPALVPKSIFWAGGRLYLGHIEAPYLTVYRLEEDTLVKEAAPALTEYQIDKVAGFNKTGRAFDLTGDLLKEYSLRRLDGRVVDCIESGYEYIQLGVFIAEKPMRKNDNLIAVTAYDRMSKMDRVADEVINGLSYPVTVLEFLQAVCDYCGVELATDSFLNSGYLVQKNVLATDISGRQAVFWAAELAAAFARMDRAGKLVLNWYEPVGYRVDSGIYTDITVNEYVTKKIEKLQVRGTDNDVGVVVGEGTNAYIIQDNPLVYAMTDEEIRPLAERIFNAVKDISYVPYRVKCKGNPLIMAGDSIEIVSRKGQKIAALVMSRKMSGVRALKDEYEATGNRERPEQVERVNSSIRRLRGRMNELTITIEETRDKLTTVETTLDKTITEVGELVLTSEGFSVTISKVQEDLNGTKEDVASMSLSLEGFNLAVNNHKLTFDKEGITVQNGGFKILSDTGESVFSVDAYGGGITMLGTVVTSDGAGRETRLSNGSIWFYENGEQAGALYGTTGSDGPVMFMNGKFMLLNAELVSASRVTADYVTCNRALVTGTETVANFSTLQCSTLTVGGSMATMHTLSVVTGITQIGTTVTPTKTTIAYLGSI